MPTQPVYRRTRFARVNPSALFVWSTCDLLELFRLLVRCELNWISLFTFFHSSKVSNSKLCVSDVCLRWLKRLWASSLPTSRCSESPKTPEVQTWAISHGLVSNLSIIASRWTVISEFHSVNFIHQIVFTDILQETIRKNAQPSFVHSWTARVRRLFSFDCNYHSTQWILTETSLNPRIQWAHWILSTNCSAPWPNRTQASNLDLI